MILYKYKAPTPFEHIADILLEQRLYCALYFSLNDPFEGVFLESMEMNGRRISMPTTPEDLINPEDGFETRVCSLSSDGSSSLLWSLYAQRLEGICFEVDCANLDPAPQQVVYTREISRFDQPGFGPNVTYALSHKSKEWQFESEYRLIGPSEYVSIQSRLRKVILGPRCNKTIEEAIRRLAPRRCDVQKARLDREARRIAAAPTLDNLGKSSARVAR
jgi:hypothetical protein